LRICIVVPDRPSEAPYLIACNQEVLEQVRQEGEVLELGKAREDLAGRIDGGQILCPLWDIEGGLEHIRGLLGEDVTTTVTTEL